MKKLWTKTAAVLLALALAASTVPAAESPAKVTAKAAAAEQQDSSRAGRLELEVNEHTLKIGSNKYLLIQNKDAQAEAACTIPSGTALAIQKMKVYLASNKTKKQTRIKKAVIQETAQADIVSGSAVTGSAIETQPEAVLRYPAVCKFSVKASDMKSDSYWVIIKDPAGNEYQSGKTAVSVSQPYTQNMTLKLGSSLKIRDLKKKITKYFQKYNVKPGRITLNNTKKAGFNQKKNKIVSKKYGTVQLTIQGSGSNKKSVIGTAALEIVPKNLKAGFGKLKKQHQNYSGYAIKRIYIKNVDTSSLKEPPVIYYKKDNGSYKKLKVTIEKIKDGEYATGDFAVASGSQWTFKAAAKYKGYSKKLETEFKLQL